jgi:hypothetical protein
MLPNSPQQPTLAPLRAAQRKSAVPAPLRRQASGRCWVSVRASRHDEARTHHVRIGFGRDCYG